MYVDPNFKSKKQLKEAIASGEEVFAFQPGLGTVPGPGQTGAVEGPHYPKPHSWYAGVLLGENGRVVKVIS